MQSCYSSCCLILTEILSLVGRKSLQLLLLHYKLLGSTFGKKIEEGRRLTTRWPEELKRLKLF